MQVVTCYWTPREAATKVKDVSLRSDYPLKFALPYNRFEPDTTTWWLSPLPGNPAYRYGKIVFTLRDAGSGFFIGLNVEKGIGLGAASFFAGHAKGKHYVMDSKWTWHQFFEALKSGDFDHLTRQVEKQVTRAVIIATGAVYVSLPTDDPYNPSLPRDFTSYSFSQGRLSPLERNYPAGILKDSETPQTLAEFAEQIQQIEQPDWVWVDFYAGFRFSTNPTEADCETWEADDIWRKACEPWQRWLY